MCIRDRMPVEDRKDMRDELYGYAIDIARGLGDARGAQLLPVSYTHLTLPTSDLV